MERDAVQLPYRGPLDWPGALAFLARRAVEGVELIERGVYRRTIRWPGAAGILDIAHDEAGGALAVTVRGLPAPGVRYALERVRHMFDLDAEGAAIDAHLARDVFMAPLVAARPSIRVFRGWDAFEVAVRSVIGQQVTVARARQLNATLVDRCAGALPGSASPRLWRLFPTPSQVLDADLSAMGMPGARVATLKHVAAAALANPGLFERTNAVDDTVARLRSIRGVGDWTAHYIAMRACGEPDAFPASDVGLLRGAAAATGRRPTAEALRASAEAWRPWRAYAAHHLWACDGASAVSGGTGPRLPAAKESGRADA